MSLTFNCGVSLSSYALVSRCSIVEAVLLGVQAFKGVSSPSYHLRIVCQILYLSYLCQEMPVLIYQYPLL